MRLMLLRSTMIAALGGFALAAPAGAAGGLTRAQMQARVKLVFNRADTNKDGFMNLAEFRVRMGVVLNRTPPGTRGAPTRQEAQRMLDAATAAFKEADSNGDGKLSLAEASKRPLAAFDALDANHDGVLTAAEQSAAAPVAGVPGVTRPQP